MKSAAREETSSSPQRAKKRIELREQNPARAKVLAELFQLSPVAARVLAARELKDDEAVELYLRPTLAKGIPHPREAKNMLAAAQMIAQAVIEKKKIAICCDFDVDGLSGGSQLFHFLKASGGDAEVFVPNRFTEGYGLNEDMVQRIADAGFSLLITIDFGTTNIKEITLAKKLGLQVAIFDHHHVSAAPPPADYFVNPQQEGCGFAGKVLSASGLVWFLIVALRPFLPSAKDIEPKEYLDLACLGTICDMVPLTGVNRIIARRGLEMLSRTKRRGLEALKDVIGARGAVSCSHVSFGIGPRLNAAGRMVDGEMVIDLLTTSAGEKAKRIAARLNKLNIERQDIEAEVKTRAIQTIEKKGYLPAGLVVYEEDFHTGVIGIVAQRLVEHFYRPAAVMGLDKDCFKGSVRGIRGISVVELLHELGEILVKFGGHEGAGGFSVKKERVVEFALAFEAACERRLKTVEVEPLTLVDTEAKLSDMSLELAQELKSFEPFGMGNPSPTLLLSNLRVMDIRIMKDAHTKVTLSDGKLSFNGILWREINHPALSVGAKVRVAARPEKNAFMGKEEVQLMLQAVEAEG
jgi:single-stranded-DNA-specific exonuclease